MRKGAVEESLWTGSGLRQKTGNLQVKDMLKGWREGARSNRYASSPRSMIWEELEIHLSSKKEDSTRRYIGWMLGTKLTRKHELKHTRIPPEEVSLGSSQVLQLLIPGDEIPKVERLELSPRFSIWYEMMCMVIHISKERMEDWKKLMEAKELLQ
jgi:hypothetical protein